MPRLTKTLMARTLIGSAAAIAACAALGAVAIAQPVPAGPPMEHGEHMRGLMRDPAQHLRAALQLRPAQEPALAAFVAAIRPGHEHEHEHWEGRDKDGPAKTTPERLADMERMMADREAKMHTMIDATRRFYDQLDPSQKRAFDVLAPMMMHRHGGEHHMRGPMGEHHEHEGPPPGA
jgi:protein CpxP